jgi:hypothetical protein
MATATVAARLRAAAEVNEQRNALYNNTKSQTGAVLAAMFPHGLGLLKPEDFERFHQFVLMVAKLCRYANKWQHGGHADSLLDISVIAMILQKLDEDIAKCGENDN